MKPVLVHSKARAELDKEIGFYERRKKGLGLDLHSQVEKTIAKIQANPELGSPYKRDFRFFRVRRFPFVIYYAELIDAIWVVAVAHGRRRPNYWRKRKRE